MPKRKANGLDTTKGPKRILALSGGGVRGIIEVAFLEAIEKSYRRRFGPETRLSDIFHLVGGTSTGALIATAVALGLPLEQVKDFYIDRAARFFRNDRWFSRFGHTARFDGQALETEFIRIIGDIELGDDKLKTLLAIVTKRLDTGSPWIVSNIPTAPYFQDPPDGSYRGNRHYHLAKLLRATTAAPTYFDQQTLEIGPGQTGTFVDGGLSPYGDPSFALFRLARAEAFGLHWPTGTENLSILSLGTGRFRQKVPPRSASRAGPLRLAYWAMRGMVTDAEEHTVALMQWLGDCPRPQLINSEIGSLADETLAQDPVFRYLRLDLPLDGRELAQAGLHISPGDLKRFHRFDDPDIITPLYQLAKDYIAKQLDLDQLLFEPPQTPGQC